MTDYQRHAAGWQKLTLGADLCVELFGSEKTKSKSCLLETIYQIVMQIKNSRCTLLVSLLGALCDICHINTDACVPSQLTIVTQSRVQASSKHQALVHNLLDLSFVGFDSNHTVLGE